MSTCHRSEGADYVTISVVVRPRELAPAGGHVIVKPNISEKPVYLGSVLFTVIFLKTFFSDAVFSGSMITF